MINTIQTLKIGGEKTEKEYEVQLVHMDDLISCITAEGGREVEHCPSRASVAKLCKLQVLRPPPRCGSLSFFTAIILPHETVPHECLLFLAFTFVWFRHDSCEKQKSRRIVKVLDLLSLCASILHKYTCYDLSTVHAGKKYKGIIWNFGVPIRAVVIGSVLSSWPSVVVVTSIPKGRHR